MTPHSTSIDLRLFQRAILMGSFSENFHIFRLLVQAFLEILSSFLPRTWTLNSVLAEKFSYN